MERHASLPPSALKPLHNTSVIDLCTAELACLGTDELQMTIEKGKLTISPRALSAREKQNIRHFAESSGF